MIKKIFLAAAIAALIVSPATAWEPKPGKCYEIYINDSSHTNWPLYLPDPLIKDFSYNPITKKLHYIYYYQERIMFLGECSTFEILEYPCGDKKPSPQNQREPYHDD